MSLGYSFPLSRYAEMGVGIILFLNLPIEPATVATGRKAFRYQEGCRRAFSSLFDLFPFSSFLSSFSLRFRLMILKDAHSRSDQLLSWHLYIRYTLVLQAKPIPRSFHSASSDIIFGPEHANMFCCAQKCRFKLRRKVAHVVTPTL